MVNEGSLGSRGCIAYLVRVSGFASEVSRECGQRLEPCHSCDIAPIDALWTSTVHMLFILFEREYGLDIPTSVPFSAMVTMFRRIQQVTKNDGTNVLNHEAQSKVLC
jgi:hypothetical protein